MYICICKGVTENDLMEVVKNGNSSLNDIQASCGAGTDCGACCRKLERVLQKHVPMEITISQEPAQTSGEK